jgi:CheY-like chemotaxis protein
VLVVEDNLDTVHTFCALLRHMGHEAEYAINGYVALDIAREFRPEVVLLDIGLPGMDGYTVARALRRDFGADVHIHAVTAYGGDDSREAARKAGCERHIVKPVDPAVMESLVLE